jgi:hypothetical protein
MGKELATIIAFAGRRIDAPDATTPRFPLTQVAVVRGQIEALFLSEHVKTLICSAACGADLIALQIAQNLGIAYRIVLPFAPEKFRVISVMDRPHTGEWNWGVLFDHVISVAQENGELVVVETGEDRHAGYQAVNCAILDEAQRYARGQIIPSAKELSEEIHTVQAAIVWDGHPRGPRDLTRHFAEEARTRGLTVREILTFQKSFNKERGRDDESHA